ncbi:MAG TPA: DUF2268 domain-containing putative Zn-dependent protease [Actinomycetota bacterium]|nr:DUF2268 domain-containing putative Zn-dependent protease [Actinomycetota bacterium]
MIGRSAARVAAEVGVDLERTARDALRRIAGYMDLPITTVSVLVRPRRATPEIGLGGSTDARADVSIFVDPAHDDLGAALDVWLPPLLAHELHHAARIVDGPGYGESLTEAMVSEGLADAFTLEAFPRTPVPPWTRALGARALCRWWQTARVESSRAGASYDHAAWFFGAGDVPRWTGYSIGFVLVERYLREHPAETPASLLEAPARKIAAGARLCAT